MVANIKIVGWYANYRTYINGTHYGAANITRAGIDKVIYSFFQFGNCYPDYDNVGAAWTKYKETGQIQCLSANRIYTGYNSRENVVKGVNLGASVYSTDVESDFRQYPPTNMTDYEQYCVSNSGCVAQTKSWTTSGVSFSFNGDFSGTGLPWNYGTPFNGYPSGNTNLVEILNNFDGYISLGGWSCSVTLLDTMKILSSVSVEQRGYTISDFIKRFLPSAMYKSTRAYGLGRPFVIDQSLPALNIKGVDIDLEPYANQWSGTSKEEVEAYVLYIQGLKAANVGLISITISGAPTTLGYFSDLQLQTLNDSVDAIYLMTYDYHGSFDGASAPTNFHSPLFCNRGRPDTWNSDAAVKAWLDRGIPSSKLYIGAAAYGRTVGFLPPTATAETALFAQYTLPETPLLKSYITLTPLYNNRADGDHKDLSIMQEVAAKRFQEVFVQESGAAFAFNKTATTSFFISYDNIDSVTLKTCYAIRLGLGGVMIWDLGGDKDNILVDRMIAVKNSPNTYCVQSDTTDFSSNMIDKLISNSRSCTKSFGEQRQSIFSKVKELPAGATSASLEITDVTLDKVIFPVYFGNGVAGASPIVSIVQEVTPRINVIASSSSWPDANNLVQLLANVYISKSNSRYVVAYGAANASSTAKNILVVPEIFKSPIAAAYASITFPASANTSIFQRVLKLSSGMSLEIANVLINKVPFGVVIYIGAQDSVINNETENINLWYLSVPTILNDSAALATLLARNSVVQSAVGNLYMLSIFTGKPLSCAASLFDATTVGNCTAITVTPTPQKIIDTIRIMQTGDSLGIATVRINGVSYTINLNIGTDNTSNINVSTHMIDLWYANVSAFTTAPALVTALANNKIFQNVALQYLLSATNGTALSCDESIFTTVTSTVPACSDIVITTPSSIIARVQTMQNLGSLTVATVKIENTTYNIVYNLVNTAASASIDNVNHNINFWNAKTLSFIDSKAFATWINSVGVTKSSVDNPYGLAAAGVLLSCISSIFDSATVGSCPTVQINLIDQIKALKIGIMLQVATVMINGVNYSLNVKIISGSTNDSVAMEASAKALYYWAASTSKWSSAEAFAATLNASYIGANTMGIDILLYMLGEATQFVRVKNLSCAASIFSGTSVSACPAITINIIDKVIALKSIVKPSIDVQLSAAKIMINSFNCYITLWFGSDSLHISGNQEGCMLRIPLLTTTIADSSALASFINAQGLTRNQRNFLFDAAGTKLACPANAFDGITIGSCGSIVPIESTLSVLAALQRLILIGSGTMLVASVGIQLSINQIPTYNIYISIADGKTANTIDNTANKINIYYLPTQQFSDSQALATALSSLTIGLSADGKLSFASSNVGIVCVNSIFDAKQIGWCNKISNLQSVAIPILTSIQSLAVDAQIQAASVGLTYNANAATTYSIVIKNVGLNSNSVSIDNSGATINIGYSAATLMTFVDSTTLVKALNQNIVGYRATISYVLNASVGTPLSCTAAIFDTNTVGQCGSTQAQMIPSIFEKIQQLLVATNPAPLTIAQISLTDSNSKSSVYNIKVNVGDYGTAIQNDARTITVTYPATQKFASSTDFATALNSNQLRIDNNTSAIIVDNVTGTPLNCAAALFDGISVASCAAMTVTQFQTILQRVQALKVGDAPLLIATVALNNLDYKIYANIGPNEQSIDNTNYQLNLWCDSSLQPLIKLSRTLSYFLSTDLIAIYEGNLLFNQRGSVLRCDKSIFEGVTIGACTPIPNVPTAATITQQVQALVGNASMVVATVQLDTTKIYPILISAAPGSTTSVDNNSNVITVVPVISAITNAFSITDIFARIYLGNQQLSGGGAYYVLYDLGVSIACPTRIFDAVVIGQCNPLTVPVTKSILARVQSLTSASQGLTIATVPVLDNGVTTSFNLNLFSGSASSSSASKDNTAINVYYHGAGADFTSSTLLYNFIETFYLTRGSITNRYMVSNNSNSAAAQLSCANTSFTLYRIFACNSVTPEIVPDSIIALMRMLQNGIGYFPVATVNLNNYQYSITVRVGQSASTINNNSSSIDLCFSSVALFTDSAAVAQLINANKISGASKAYQLSATLGTALSCAASIFDQATPSTCGSISPSTTSDSGSTSSIISQVLSLKTGNSLHIANLAFDSYSIPMNMQYGTAFTQVKIHADSSSPKALLTVPHSIISSTDSTTASHQLATFLSNLYIGEVETLVYHIKITNSYAGNVMSVQLSCDYSIFLSNDIGSCAQISLSSPEERMEKLTTQIQTTTQAKGWSVIDGIAEAYFERINEQTKVNLSDETIASYLSALCVVDRECPYTQDAITNELLESSVYLLMSLPQD